MRTTHRIDLWHPHVHCSHAHTCAHTHMHTRKGKEPRGDTVYDLRYLTASNNNKKHKQNQGTMTHAQERRQSGETATEPLQC